MGSNAQKPDIEVDKPKVLFLEDSASSQRLIPRVLERDGYKVFDKSSWEECGIAWVMEKQINLIVLDVSLHFMDGFTIASLLKNDERTAQIPILGMSAHNEYEHRPSHFDRFILKPINIQAFRLSITEMLTK